jgi:integrase
MNTSFPQFGSQNALADLNSSERVASDAQPLTTMSDLLNILAKNPPPEFAMLRSTCSLFAAYLNQAAGEISIDAINESRDGFRSYLESHKYKKNAVRSYINYVRILLVKAKALGWKPGRVAPEAWREVLAMSQAKGCSGIAVHLMHNKENPKNVTIEDVNDWLMKGPGKELRYPYARKKTTHFWRVLRECRCTDQMPMCFVREQRYGVPLGQFPPDLKREVTELLRWKCAEYSMDRPKKGRHRAVTSQFLQQTFCTLLGYLVNVRSESEITSIRDLVRRDYVGGYVEWCINERKIKGGPLQRKLGVLWSALRHHPSHKSADWSWLRLLADGIPIEHESELRKRKAAKFLEYSVVESIVEQIHAAKLISEKRSSKLAANLCMQELLIRWLITLPWRQRNVREMRINGSKPNLFRGPIAPFSAIDKNEWVLQEEKRNPAAEFWQFAFSPEETKTKVAPHAVLPRQLIETLEEYLTKWRPILLRTGDPGTLFLNCAGGPLSILEMTNLVSDLTLRYGGRRVTPHLFRDIVAFTWLKEHPKDFLTLSKQLWHSNVNTTIRIYGGRFNESSGVCAMESWLNERAARAKSK